MFICRLRRCFSTCRPPSHIEQHVKDSSAWPTGGTHWTIRARAADLVDGGHQSDALLVGHLLRRRGQPHRALQTTDAASVSIQSITGIEPLDLPERMQVTRLSDIRGLLFIGIELTFGSATGAFAEGVRSSCRRLAHWLRLSCLPTRLPCLQHTRLKTTLYSSPFRTSRQPPQ